MHITIRDQLAKCPLQGAAFGIRRHNHFLADQRAECLRPAGLLASKFGLHRLQRHHAASASFAQPIEPDHFKEQLLFRA